MKINKCLFTVLFLNLLTSCSSRTQTLDLLIKNESLSFVSEFTKLDDVEKENYASKVDEAVENIDKAKKLKKTATFYSEDFSSKIVENYYSYSVIPDSVVDICDRCFACCSNLCQVCASDSSCLERIGCWAFGKSCVHSFCLPRNVKEVGGAMFACCRCLLTVSPENVHFVKSDGLLMSRDLKKIYDWSQDGQYFIIPDYATEICDHCCYHNDVVTDVMFGPFPSLERIGWESFTGVQLTSFGKSCNWLHHELGA